MNHIPYLVLDYVSHQRDLIFDQEIVDFTEIHQKINPELLTELIFVRPVSEQSRQNLDVVRGQRVILHDQNFVLQESDSRDYWPNLFFTEIPILKLNNDFWVYLDHRTQILLALPVLALLAHLVDESDYVNQQFVLFREVVGLNLGRSLLQTTNDVGGRVEPVLRLYEFAAFRAQKLFEE